MRPLVGISLWDTEGWDLDNHRPATGGSSHYERVLRRHLDTFDGLLWVAELAQQADYQNQGARTWSRLDLMSVPGFPAFLLRNLRLAVHLRHAMVDIADHENETHRQWSLMEVKKGLDFAFRLGADACMLHPGTYNERSGHFWPRADEVAFLVENRRRALDKSLAELAGHLVTLAASQERRLADFERAHKGLFGELKSLLAQVRGGEASPEEHIRLLAKALDMIQRGRLTAEQVRHCQSPWSGLHVCVENLEPPNFLICTPVQARRVFRRLDEFFLEAASHGGLGSVSVDRYGPRLVVDPAHMLNAYEESEAVAARIGASKMGLFEKRSDSVVGDLASDANPAAMEANPGTFEIVPDGYEFKAWEPEHPTAQFPAFIKQMLRKIASGFSVFYNVLANDAEGVSYSTMRSFALVERDDWRSIQQDFIDMWRRPLYSAWLGMALLSGTLKLASRDPSRYTAVRHRSSGWQWVTPEKEAKAAVISIQNGLGTRTGFLAEKGEDIEDVFAELAHEEALAREYGIAISGDAAAPAEKPESEEDESAATQSPGGNGDGSKAGPDIVTGRDRNELPLRPGA